MANRQKPTEEHRSKLGHLGNKHALGHKHNSETRKRMSDSHIGKTLSEEAKLKLSEKRKGENNPFWGQSHTKEFKLWASENMKREDHGAKKFWDSLTKKEKLKICMPGIIAANRTQPKAYTSIEIAVQEVLDILNIEYEAQKPIGKYIADFYIPAQNLIIECDGDYWHSLPDVKKRDKQKDKYLRKQGYTVKRLPEKVIKNDKHTAVKQVLGVD